MVAAEGTVSMPVRQRGDSWQADVRFEGQRIRCSFSSPASAHEWELRAQTDVKLGRRPSMPAGDSKMLTMKQALDRVIEREWTEAKTKRHLSFNATQVVEMVGPNRMVRDVDYDVVEDLIKQLRERGDKNGTINRKLAALSKLISYAQRLDPKLSRPKIPRLREAPPRERALNEREFNLLRGWNGWREIDRDFLIFLWYTGCRISEPFKKADGKGGMTVRDGYVTFHDTKNGDDRTIPLHDEAQRAYDHGFLDINQWTFRHRFREAVEALDLGPNVVVHTLRHSCATRLARKGKNAFKIQAWMGHKSISTTQRYVKKAGLDLDDLMEVL
jgi:integrase